MDLINWLEQNWESVIGILAAIHVIARYVVSLTDTPDDDKKIKRVMKVIKKVLDLLGANTGKLRMVEKKEMEAVKKSVEKTAKRKRKKGG